MADLGVGLHSNIVLRVDIIKWHDKVQLWKGGPYWATTNIGAENPEDFGYYFWWGDTVGYKRENDKWAASDGSSQNFSFCSNNTPTYGKKWSALRSTGWITAENVLVPAHDAAQVHWGGKWRMPTIQVRADLYYKCDWTSTTVNGVKGYVVRGRGDYVSASIFLPAAGYGTGTSLNSVGASGYYWFANPHANGDGSHDYDYASNIGGNYVSDAQCRYFGLSIRPIQLISE